MIAGLALVLGCLVGCTTPAAPPPQDPRLPAPLDKEERAYLGLPDGATNFVLEDISAEVLIVDFFDMYCHICQSEAEHMNRLYLAAQERGLGQRVKFVGIGVGDTSLEAATFKRKFKVPFPIFPDRKAQVARRFGELKVPGTLALRRRDGQLQLILRATRPPRDPAEFFASVLSPTARVLLPLGSPQEAGARCTIGGCPFRRSLSARPGPDASREAAGTR